MRDHSSHNFASSYIGDHRKAGPIVSGGDRRGEVQLLEAHELVENRGTL
jgi:hypothetical protein